MVIGRIWTVRVCEVKIGIVLSVVILNSIVIGLVTRVATVEHARGGRVVHRAGGETRCECRVGIYDSL